MATCWQNHHNIRSAIPWCGQKQIFRLNNNGESDDVNLYEVVWGTLTGSSAINTWQTVDISYTATAADASSANGIGIRLFKTFGTGMKIDDFGVTCITCPNNSSIGSSYLSI